MKEPETPAEWEDAVAWAEACLLLDSARQYGLVTGGPGVDVDRCVAVLEQGRSRGYSPTKAAVDLRIQALVAGTS